MPLAISRLTAFSMAFFPRVRGVLDELGDFHREPEEDRRDLRDVVRAACPASKIAAIGAVAPGLAARNQLQRQAHISRADFFHVAALLNHAEQHIVALVEQGHFVAHLLQLQRDGLRVFVQPYGSPSFYEL